MTRRSRSSPKKLPTVARSLLIQRYENIAIVFFVSLFLYRSNARPSTSLRRTSLVKINSIRCRSRCCSTSTTPRLPPLAASQSSLSLPFFLPQWHVFCTENSIQSPTNAHTMKQCSLELGTQFKALAYFIVGFPISGYCNHSPQFDLLFSCFFCVNVRRSTIFCFVVVKLTRRHSSCYLSIDISSTPCRISLRNLSESQNSIVIGC